MRRRDRVSQFFEGIRFTPNAGVFHRFEIEPGVQKQQGSGNRENQMIKMLHRA